MASGEQDETERRRRFSRRAALLGLAHAGAFSLIGTRLFKLQVVDGPRFALLAEENRVSIRALPPVRGRILDRYGEVLASNKEGYRAEITPALAGDVRKVVAGLARILDLDEAEQARLVARARRQPRNLPLMVASDLSFEQIARINLMAPHLPGVTTEADTRRRYFHGATVGHVVGFTGAPSKPALDDDSSIRLPGTRVGKSGAERGMEETLRGAAGHVKSEVDARGRVIRELEKTPPRDGNDVVLTIDTALQEKILDRLSGERRAAIVAMDVVRGEVLAMASVPRFDNAEMAGAVDGGTMRRLLTTSNNPMVNRAIRGAYPPGSTFKMVTMLAGLEAGVVGIRDRIVCTGRYDYAGQAFRCWRKSGHGACDLHRALKESCDCYFYEVARRTGIDAIAAMARRLGLGQTYDSGIAFQKPGVVPDPDWKRLRLGKPWFGGETILSGIGQGYVLTTPLQLAVMTARLATGRAVQPTLVRTPDTSEPPELRIRPEWLSAVQRAMYAVVYEEGGTGAAARIDDPAMRLAGKSGTSQVSRASTQRSHGDLAWEERDHALFVGFAPSNAPRYAVAAIVEHAGSGGQVSGPLVRDVMLELMRRDPAGRPALHMAGAGLARGG